MPSHPGGTIGSALSLLFDTAIIVVTLLHMLESWHLHKGLKSQKRSLTTIMLEQGELSQCVFTLGFMTEENDSIRHTTLSVYNFCQIFVMFHVDHNQIQVCSHFWRSS